MKLKSLVISGLLSVGAWAGAAQQQVFTVGSDMTPADREAIKAAASSGQHHFMSSVDDGKYGERRCQAHRTVGAWGEDGGSTSISCWVVWGPYPVQLFIDVYDDPNKPVSVYILDSSEGEDEIIRGKSITLHLSAKNDR